MYVFWRVCLLVRMHVWTLCVWDRSFFCDKVAFSPHVFGLLSDFLLVDLCFVFCHVKFLLYVQLILRRLTFTSFFFLI